MRETEPYHQCKLERRHRVQRAIAAVERTGGVVGPVARRLYGRYAAGELTLGQVCHLIDQHAAEVAARARAAIGWVE